MPDFHGPTYRLHYAWGGAPEADRPALIMLHDGLGAIGSWRNLPERLARTLSVNTLVYDRWGYGRSEPRPAFEPAFMEAEVPVLEALLNHLGLRQVTLLGHSDGGSIALLCAAQHPDRVRAVVTEAAHTFVEPETQNGIRELVRLQRAGRTPAWLGKLHGTRGEAVLQAWSDCWLGDVHARWDIRGELSRIRCPVLAIQGDADEFGTQAQVDSILGALPGAQSWIVPDCGHTPHSQAEDAFVERVETFLRPILQA